MRTLLWVVIIAGGIYAVVYLVNREKVLAANVTYNIIGYQVQSLSSDNTQIALQVQVNNPSDIPITINSANGTLLASGSPAGTAALQAPFTVPAGVSGTGSIVYTVDPSALGGTIASALLGAITGGGIQIVATGVLNVSAFGTSLISTSIPFTYTQTIKL